MEMQNKTGGLAHFGTYKDSLALTTFYVLYSYECVFLQVVDDMLLDVETSILTMLTLTLGAN
jgi:hypothetical protein